MVPLKAELEGKGGMWIVSKKVFPGSRDEGPKDETKVNGEPYKEGRKEGRKKGHKGGQLVLDPVRCTDHGAL